MNLRICQVGTGILPIQPLSILPKYSGSIETVIYYLSRELSSRNKVFLIDISNNRRNISDNYYVYSIDRYFSPQRCFGNKIIFFTYGLNSVLLLSKIIEKDNLDILHFHHEFSGFFGTNFLRKNSRVHTIYTLHNATWSMDERCRKKMMRYVLFREVISLRKADKVVALNNIAKYNLIKFLGITPDKIEVIPNGIDTDFFKSENFMNINHGDNIHILCVARISREKNQITLLKALSKVIQEYSSIKCFLVGPTVDKKYYEELCTFIANHNLDKIVFFTGAIDTAKLLELYSSADIYVLPSLMEGSPLTILEAMSFGKPIITSNIVACTELLHDSGICLDPLNVFEWENAIKLLIYDEGLRKEHGKKARMLAVKKYRWAEIVKKYEKLYNSW